MRKTREGFPKMANASDPRENRILAALPVDELERIGVHLRTTMLTAGQVLYDCGGALPYAYFPTTAIACLMYVMQNGMGTEVAIVGNDGVAGVAVFLGGASASSQAVVQCGGAAYRMPGPALKEEFLRGGALQRLLLRYTQALITQMRQTAVCNRHHSVEQQLCRLLLLSLDRSASDDLTLTQEVIATQLGVRREGVCEAAARLQDAGLIRYRRGHIALLDRRGLELRVCECYAAVKQECARLESEPARELHDAGPR